MMSRPIGSSFPYILAIDVGGKSIGFAIVRLSKDGIPIALIRLGVRIYSDGRDPSKNTSKAAGRTEKRQARKTRYRKIQRTKHLIKTLVQFGFFPNSKQSQKALENLNPYHLRTKGLDEALTPYEMGRAIFHLNRKRAFQSNRKADKTNDDSGPMKKAISTLEEAINATSMRTVGEWQNQRLLDGKGVKARLYGQNANKHYDFYVKRSQIKEEFDLLWNKQKSFQPEIYTDEAYEALQTAVFFQRPLKPVEPGRCTLQPDEQRAAKAMPIVQQFLLYQEVNHLRIIGKNLKETPLTLEQRDLLISELNKKDLTFKTMKERLLKARPGLDIESFNFEKGPTSKFKGNAINKTLAQKKHFGKAWYGFSLERQTEIVNLLLNEASEENVIKWLTTHTSISEEQATVISSANLPSGYARLSLTAAEKITEALKNEVITYDKAVLKAGLGSHSQLSYKERTGELLSQLPYYGKVLERRVNFGTGIPGECDEKRYGKIANPTVHVGLNELRKVVNEILSTYGNPTKIAIEMCRDIANGQKKRQEIKSQNTKNQKVNEALLTEACEILGAASDNLDKSKKRHLIRKMKLWRELNPNDVADRRCPYTGQMISMTKLLSEEVEIEHILPFSRTLDSSMNNLTLSMRGANRYKSHLTPYEAFGKKPVDGFDYEAILRRASIFPTPKKRRFAEDGFDYWLNNEKDFTARCIHDTAYFATVAREYLSCVCLAGNIQCISGRQTALIRKIFGLNKILANESEEKNRDDHRHHAIDAAVIAITDHSLMKTIAKAAKDLNTHDPKKLSEQVELPWPRFYDQLDQLAEHIKVSHRPEHGYQGPMHLESVWSPGLNGSHILHKRDSSNSWKREKKISKSTHPLILIRDASQSERHGLDENGQPKPFKAIEAQNNYSTEIYLDPETDKWCFEVITVHQAYQVVKRLGESKGIKRLLHPKLTQSDKPLVMRLIADNLLKLKINNEYGLYRIVSLVKDGNINLVSSHLGGKGHTFKKNFNTIMDLAPIPVTVSPMGILKEQRIRAVNRHDRTDNRDCAISTLSVS